MKLTQEQRDEIKKCVLDPSYFIEKYCKIRHPKHGIIPFHLHSFQQTVLTRFENYQNNVINKSRQCLPKGTFIDTPYGPVAIENLKKGDIVYSYDFNLGKVVEDRVKDAWCSGNRQIIKMKLKDCRNIFAGENHPFYRVGVRHIISSIKSKIIPKQGEWKKARDLNIGEILLDAPIEFGNVFPNEHDVIVLAYLLTDGCTKIRVKFTNNNPLYLDEFTEHTAAIFPQLYINKISKNKGFDIYFSQTHGKNSKNSLMKWCEDYGIANTSKKLIPQCVFSWDKKSVALFLNRMFAADGWISILRKGKSTRLEIGFGSLYKEVVEQIRFLFKKFDIKCNIYESPWTKLQTKPFFRLRISHSKSIAVFLKEIGIYGKVTEEHLKISNECKHDVLDIPEVRKIEFQNFEECYDISVEKNENFLINGLVVHNTGLSTLTSCYVLWILQFQQHKEITVVSRRDDEAIAFVDKVRLAWDYLPDWLRVSKKGSNNQHIFTLATGSKIKAEAKSKNAARSSSLNLLILDEAAHIDVIRQIWESARPTLSRGRGKCIIISCVNPNSWIFTDKGMQQVGDFITPNTKLGFNIVSPFKIDGRKGLQECRTFYDSGETDTRIIRTQKGFTLECTKIHPIHVFRDGSEQWIRSQDLQIGDFVAVKRGSMVFGDDDDVSRFMPNCRQWGKSAQWIAPKKLDRDFGRLLGLIISEGHIRNNNRTVNIAAADQEIIDYLLSKPFGLSFKLTRDNQHCEVSSTNFCEFLRYLGFPYNTRSPRKTIPKRLLQCSKEVIYGILQGLFDGDGSAHGKRGTISYASSSEDLLIQIQLLLLNIGIVSSRGKMRHVEPTKKVPAESLVGQIEICSDAKMFYDIIGFGMKRKQEKLFMLPENNRRQFDILPGGASLINEIRMISEETNKQAVVNGFNAHGYSTLRLWRGNDTISFVTARKAISHYDGKIFCDAFQELQRRVKDNFLWVKIEKITESRCHTYDFHIPVDHSFTSNGIISHNTPNGVGNLFHETVEKAQLEGTEGWNRFKYTFCHWRDVPEYDDEWYANERPAWTDKGWAQEYEGDFLGSGNTVISSERLKNLQNQLKNPIGFLDMDMRIAMKGEVWFWELPRPNNKYIIGGDTASGDGNDNSAAQVFNITTCTQVAEVCLKDISPKRFAKLLYNLANFYNEAYLVIENNGPGVLTCDELFYNLNYWNMFLERNVQTNKVNFRKPGFKTSVKSRPLIIEGIKTIFDSNNNWTIKSQRLFQEATTFIWHNSRPEAEVGYNDDLIISLGLIGAGLQSALIDNPSFSNDVPQIEDNESVWDVVDDDFESINPILEEFGLKNDNKNINTDNIYMDDDFKDNKKEHRMFYQNNTTKEFSWLYYPTSMEEN